MKIAFCTDGIFPHAVGGMQRHSRLLIEELAKSPDVQITVFHPHSEKIFKNFPNVEEIMIEDIDKSKNYLLENYKYSKRIFEHLKNMPEYIIYSQGLSVWSGIRHLPNKIIVNPHGLEPYQAIGYKNKIVAVPFKIIFNRIFRYADYVVSLGGLLTNILKIRISEKKIINLPNGTNIPAEYTRQTDDNHINIFFISRFASNKGIDILLEVADELNREGQSNITYILGGKGPLFEPLKQKYTAENIRFLGFVSDEQLSVLYIKSDLFVLPTLFEGMPTVVLEAMSYKLPVIVSNVGATAELVDESNGWLISKNSKSELKNAILRFISLTPQQRTGLGENSYKKFAENFTWTQIAQKHIDFFQSIK